MAEQIQTLDLTRRARPVIELDCGKFEMRRPQEFYFEDYARIAAAGEKIAELAEAGLVENAAELDELIGVSVGELLIDATDEAKKMPFALFRELMEFFNGLVSGDGADTGESASNSPPGANDSTEDSAAV